MRRAANLADGGTILSCEKMVSMGCGGSATAGCLSAEVLGTIPETSGWDAVVGPVRRILISCVCLVFSNFLFNL